MLTFSQIAHPLAAELSGPLHALFRISIRVRTIEDGLAFRVYQVRKPKNRHFVDIRMVEELPPLDESPKSWS